MSKPDPTGGSLESILASIRKSLSEQSTDALSDTPATPVDQDKQARPTRRHGLAQRLAGTTPEATARGGAPAADDLSDLLEQGPAPSAKAAPVADAPKVAEGASHTSPPEADSDGPDPLWFLTRRDEPVAEGALPPVDATPAPQAPAAAANSVNASPTAEPVLTRPEVLRASMPPFFGSSAEAAVPSADGLHVPQPPQGAAPVGGDAAIAREVSLLAAAAEAAAGRPPPQASPQPALNGKGPAAVAPAPGTALAGDTPVTRALETAVLDLLKPMLRQWLDENMPRMVAEALEEEVRRTRGTKGGVKKT